MAIQVINNGSNIGDPNAESVWQSFEKSKLNFQEIEGLLENQGYQKEFLDLNGIDTTKDELTYIAEAIERGKKVGGQYGTPWQADIGKKLLFYTVSSTIVGDPNSPSSTLEFYFRFYRVHRKGQVFGGNGGVEITSDDISPAGSSIVNNNNSNSIELGDIGGQSIWSKFNEGQPAPNLGDEWYVKGVTIVTAIQNGVGRTWNFIGNQVLGISEGLWGGDDVTNPDYLEAQAEYFDLLSNQPTVNSDLFITKASKQYNYVEITDVDPEIFVLSSGKSSFSVTNTGGSGIIGGFEGLSSGGTITYDGMDVYIRNGGAVAFTLEHNNGDADAPFWFVNEEDLQLNPGDIAHLKYNKEDSRVELIVVSNSDTSGFIDVENNNVTYGRKNQEWQPLYGEWEIIPKPTGKDYEVWGGANSDLGGVGTISRADGSANTALNFGEIPVTENLTHWELAFQFDYLQTGGAINVFNLSTGNVDISDFVAINIQPDGTLSIYDKVNTITQDSTTISTGDLVTVSVEVGKVQVSVNGTLELEWADASIAFDNAWSSFSAVKGFDLSNIKQTVYYAFVETESTPQDTVSSLKAKTGILEGDFIETKGFYAENDGGGAIYEKVNPAGLVPNNMDIIEGNDGSYYVLQVLDSINIMQLGAKKSDNTFDNQPVIQRAFELALNSERTSKIVMPSGEFYIENPIILLKESGFFNLEIEGSIMPYGNAGYGGVTVIKNENELPFAMAIQGARGVTIKNLVIEGELNSDYGIYDLISQTQAELSPNSKRYAPISGVVIDPFGPSLPSDGGYTGLESYYNGNAASSSKIKIENCTIKNFQNGITVSPNGELLQADSITIDDVEINNAVNAVITCEAQSRRISFTNCDIKRVKYVFNTLDYGLQQGIMPEVVNLKIADGSAWIFKHNGVLSYAHFVNVYGEALYGIGYAGINRYPCGFVNSTIKLTPYTDNTKKYPNPCILKATNFSLINTSITVGGGASHKEPLVMDVEELSLLNAYLDSKILNFGSSLATTVANKIKDFQSSYRNDEFFGIQVTDEDSNNNRTVSYDTGSELYTFIPDSRSEGYTTDDFVFGKVELTEDPFVGGGGETIYTVLGKVESFDGGTGEVAFKSNLLPTDGNDFSQRIAWKLLKLPNEANRVHKEIEIGNWDMDADVTKSIPHNLSATEFLTIRNLSVSITDNLNSFILDFATASYAPDTSTSVEHKIYASQTNIHLERADSGEFDNNQYSGTAVNRGWITFTYIPD